MIMTKIPCDILNAMQYPKYRVRLYIAMLYSVYEYSHRKLYFRVPKYRWPRSVQMWYRSQYLHI